MTAVTQAITAALLHFVWQGILVAFILWVVLFLMRHRTAQSRYLAAWIALAVLAVLPAATALLEYTAPPPSALVLSPGPFATAFSGTGAGHLISRAAASRTAWMALWQAWALPAWSLGVLLFALRAVWGCGRISVLRRHALAAPAEVLERVSAIAGRLGLARPVHVFMGAFTGSPSVLGWLRPVILLPPATLLGLTPEQLEAVLAHELAHIRRHDSLMNAAQILVETVLFYHPAVWWTSARIREERELCCDDLAVNACGDALCYARALTRLERLRLTAPALALGGSDGPLAYRIRRLMGGATREDAPSKLPGVLALVLGLVCLGANVHWARGQEPKPAAWQPVVMGDVREQQDKVKAEMDALRQRVRELEEQLQKENVRDVNQAAAQLAKQAAEQAARGNEQKRTLEMQQHSLQAALADLRKRLANLQQVYKDDYPDVVAQRQLIAGLESKMAATEDAMAERNTDFAEIQKQTSLAQQEFAKRIAVDEAGNLYMSAASEQKDAQQRLQEALQRRNEAREIVVTKQGLSNWTVKSIEIEGLTPEARDALAANLPVKLGSKLTEYSADAIANAIKKSDQHLTFTITLGDKGEAVIHISRPRL